MATNGSGGDRRDKRSSALEIVLHGPVGSQPLGHTPQITVEVRNIGPSAVWMVGVLDGSEEGIRYPHYRPVILRDGQVVASPGQPEDPMVTPLRLADFRRLAPGEVFDPTARIPLTTFGNFNPSTPGIYRYLLRVVTASESPEEWLSTVGQDAERGSVLELVREVPSVTITSAPLDVQVR